MSKHKLENLIVFTDGSCLRNGRVGAVGGIGIHFPDRELKDISKTFKGPCTNQKTELYAILQALRYIHTNLKMSRYRIIVKTDSMYCINCVTKWAEGWIDNGWIKQDGKPVANRELIEKVYKYYAKYFIILDHVSAHTGGDDYDSIGNEIADDLANNAAKRSLSQANLELLKSKNNTKPSKNDFDPIVNLIGSKNKKAVPKKKNSGSKINPTKRKSPKKLATNEPTKRKSPNPRTKKSGSKTNPSQTKRVPRKRTTTNGDVVVELIGFK